LASKIKGFANKRKSLESRIKCLANKRKGLANKIKSLANRIEGLANKRKGFLRSVQTTVSFTKFSFEEKEVLGLLSPLKILFFSLANIDNI